MTVSNSFAAQTESFSFKKLLMPGPVAELHAEFESDCANCHGELGDVTPNRLCLDCHEDIAADIKAKLGYHGREFQVSKANCTTCHTEHLGRSGSIVEMDADGFDHQKTDFELLGKHAVTTCYSCHKAQQKFREASSKCLSCHEDDDIHQGAMDTQCQDCHSFETWSDVEFDHNDTQFSLKGEHKTSQCADCHPDQQYQDTPTACLACHALNDVHNAVNGDQCERCHDESAWSEIRFNHDRDTEFRLLGGHLDLQCNECHQSSGFEKELNTSCVSCHTKDDPHNELNGPKCENCHAVNKWTELTFDHNRDSDFPLQGNHQQLDCAACHPSGTENVDLEQSCIACHKIDDVHSGKQGELCNNCHKASGWSEEVSFSHNLSAFALVGMHAVAACDACHESQSYSETSSRCIDCHLDEDSHNGALGPDCAVCHNPNDWQLWLFNHDEQTSFDLQGAHQSLSCNACHKKPATKKIRQSSSCVACHAQDDQHNGRFGRACDRCHGHENFSEIRIQ